MRAYTLLDSVETAGGQHRARPFGSCGRGFGVMSVRSLSSSLPDCRVPLSAWYTYCYWDLEAPEAGIL